MSKFFTYSQNNSGGFFEEDTSKGVGVTVIIEAHDAEHANDRARDIGLYFDGVAFDVDCPCCVDRWYKVEDSDGTDTPMLDGTPINECVRSIFTKNAFVYYLDGTIKETVFKCEQ